MNETIRARMIVGAAGHFCPVARALNPDAAESAVVAAQEIEFALNADAGQAASCPVAGSTPELFFWPDLSGYGWCVRKGAFLNIGAGRLAPSPLPAAMQEFAAMLGRRTGVLPESAPKWKGHAYLLNRSSRRRLLGDGVLLVGDAAGLALAPSGEGILAAVESGLLAADAILHARPDYAASRLAPYASHVRQRFGSRKETLPAEAPRWMTAAVFRALLTLPWLTRRVLLESGFLHTRRSEIRS